MAADAARSIVDDMPKRETGVRDLRGEAEQLARSVTFYPPLQECRKHLQAIWDKRHQSRDRIAAIDSELTVLTEEVLGRCRVLGTTVYRTYLVSGCEFCKCSEPLVVDEAR